MARLLCSSAQLRHGYRAQHDTAVCSFEITNQICWHALADTKVHHGPRDVRVPVQRYGTCSDWLNLRQLLIIHSPACRLLWCTGPGYIDPNDSVTSGRARTPAVDFNASRTPRFKDAVEGGPDSAVYAAAMQQGAAASIAAKVARSPQRYSGMSSPTPRRIEAPKDRALVVSHCSAPQ